MSKYIDADFVRNDFASMVYDILSDAPTNDRANDIINCFDTLPTADVEPVKHGKWRHGENFGGEYFECSVCAYKFRPPISGEYYYCPHCGAKIIECEYLAEKDGGSE